MLSFEVRTSRDALGIFEMGKTIELTTQHDRKSYRFIEESVPQKIKKHRTLK